MTINSFVAVRTLEFSYLFARLEVDNLMIEDLQIIQVDYIN